MRYAAAIGLLSLLLGGCAVVEINSGDGAARIERHAGVLMVKIDPSDTSHIVEASGVGLITDPGGTTLGYGTSRYVAFANGCQLVVFSDNAAQSRKLKQAIPELGKACIVN